MGCLVTKSGEKVTASVESVLATCGIISVERDPDGTGYILQYDDMGSDICYDSMEQIKRDGQFVYQTQDGTQYLENELRLVPDDDNGNPIIWTNHYKCPCGAEWDDDWSCQCDDDCPECGATCSPSESASLIDFTDEEKATQKHNAQMLDGCETEDEFNAELRAQTQGDT